MNGLNRLGQIGAQWLLDEWNATEQPIQQRGGVLPLGIYEDGSAHLAWPGMITDTFDAFERAGQGPGMQNPEDAFIIGGSLGVGGLAAPRPRNALASNSVRQEAPAAVNALADDAPRGITAYHGSPHDFDKFSLDKIGTGEGAQVYGHGLYFAKEEAVAKNYRDRLSRKAFNLDGKRLPMDHYLFDAGYRFGDAESTDDALRRMAAERRREVEYKSKLPETSLGRRSVPALLKEADELESMVGRLTENKGRMYKVRINAEPDQFIDWDKPLSQQSEAVRNVIEPLRQQLSLEWADINPTLGEPTHLGQVLASKPQASQALREAGIPGIRYLDGMSRGAGEGSSNYVVFDENLIDILEKYANPWTSAPLGLAPNAFEDPRQALINRLAEVY